MSSSINLSDQLTVRLGDLGYTYPGLSGKSKDDFGFGKPYIPYMNIFSNCKIKKGFLEFVDIKPTDRQNKVQTGDLFFTTSSETVEEVGMTSVLLDDIGEAYLNSFCFGFRLYNFDILLPEFAAYLFRGDELRKKISLFGQGSTRYNLPKTQMFQKLYLNLPDKVQQQKIAHILTTCDTVIEQTQSAIAKYKAIKQGLLHDLFTRGLDANGHLRPSYPDAPELYKETELGMIPKDWKMQRLVEIATMKSGDGITSAFIADTGDFPVYGGNGLRGYTTAFTHEGDYVLIGRQGALCGNITRVSNKFFASEHAVVVTVNKDIDVDWLSQKLDAMNLNQYSEASAQPGLAVAKILRLFITKPQHNEQKEIGKRLLSLDNKMHAEEILLQKYQSIKRGLMGDLLGGRKTVDNGG
ncbi:MAG: restriction endonuclease subunit S [Bacteroidota bacterium]|nr:restriction endonuclease subunit S [Bacteroidota bacterium]